MGAILFTDKILRVRLSKGFDKPTDMKYDGTKDLQEHIMDFEAKMNLEGVVDAVQCWAFPVTLVGSAIKWFNALPNGSISCFDDISQKFLAQFTTHIAKVKHLISLLGITQCPEESTRKYLDGFNNECLTIDGLTDSIASLYLNNGLMNQDFRKHLTTKQVWTMHEIQNVGREYINDKEVSQIVAANKRHHGNMAPQTNPPQKEPNKDQPRLPVHNRTPRVGKFTNDTLIPVPIIEIYHQIAETDVLSKARQLKECTGGNKILYYNYHKGYGHRTQDYFNLKDTLEQAIRDGKLPKFSKNSMAKEDAPYVILAKVGTGIVKWILVDTGADSNILFKGAFDKLDLRNEDLQNHFNRITV
ncbi:uncharacterized protein LOC130945884 [Arachis stenosperma]|uniref:uncharacterized protein LOC130945884 n=1 Tax=Arachis stenosperma TaxID=217475 RepID=UPI0025ACDE20|nr:uncharacterized protein LOC130945884 [Arachis stenosperma]